MIPFAENINAKVYRWGIIGPGRIAEKFAAALPLAGNAVLQAVASRDAAKANEFGAKHGASSWYDSYEQLASDPDIDVVYIATPHAFHCEQALLCLNKGKAVLCEKPMALNSVQVTEMINASVKNNVFLMEAMWTRFLPVIEHALKLIKEGTIGEITHISADFGFDAPFDPKSRLFDLNLGGGSLLDVGVYPLSLVLTILGAPENIQAEAQLANTGADASCRALLSYKNDVTAQISSGVSHQTPITAEIIGTKGNIKIASPWYKTNTLTVEVQGKEPQTITLDPVVNGFEYQIREVMKCLEDGKKESSRMPRRFSLLLSKTMDNIRQQIGVVYPADKQPHPNSYPKERG